MLKLIVCFGFLVLFGCGRSGEETAAEGQKLVLEALNRQEKTRIALDEKEK